MQAIRFLCSPSRGGSSLVSRRTQTRKNHYWVGRHHDTEIHHHISVLIMCNVVFYGEQTFVIISRASSFLPLEHSHLGLSGGSHMPKNWIAGIAICTPTGIFQAALDVYLTVPNTVQAATMEPTYHSVLYMVVSVPRCWGYASSMIKRGAEPWARLDLHNCGVSLTETTV